MKRWYEQYPERLQYELEALSAAGYEYELDQERLAASQVVIKVKYPLDDQVHELTVRFPDFFPLLPFDIFGPTLPPGRHLCPNSGILCLMQNPHTNWTNNITLAMALDNQVRDIIDAHRDPENAIEAHEGMQRTGHYDYVLEAILLTSDWQIPEDVKCGRLLIGLEPNCIPSQLVRGSVIEVFDSTGKSLGKLPDRVAALYPKRIEGRWARMDFPPDGRVDGPGPLAQVIKNFASLGKPKFTQEKVDIVGILFPEESAYKVRVDNWIFTLRLQASPNQPPKLIRTDTIDQANMLARVPNLTPLSNKKVLVVGAGAIGSQIGWQLARAGLGSVTFLDHDHVQVGNFPRWLLGMPAVGRMKSKTLADFLRSSYPFTESQWACYRLGTAPADINGSGDIALLEKALQGVDLVIDATAEKRISQVISTTCRERNICYVWATGTPGSQGGTIGRVIPEKTKGCWKCFLHHMDDGSIITPSKDDGPGVQPKGCYHPTFTGTGFDMDNVSLAAVRLAISTLCEGQEHGYPELGFDVGILNLWDKDGTPTLPQWVPYQLGRHPNCPDHE